MNKKPAEIRKNGKTVYDGKILKLNVDEVLLENGKTATREYVAHRGGAAIIAETEDGILFVEQFRYPYREYVLELPAGKRENGENPVVTARRELEEETGYKAGKLKFLCEVYPSPGYTDERLYLFLATEFEKSQMHLDEDEFLSVRAIKAEEVVQMIALGQIKDAKTLIALLEYFCFYRNNGGKEEEKEADGR